jgi:hypothetical protein
MLHSNVLMDLVNQFHSVTSVNKMVVMLLLSVLLTNHIYALMENVLVTKTSVEYNSHVHYPLHSYVKIRLAPLTRMLVLRNQYAHLTNRFFVPQVFVLNTHMSVPVLDPTIVQVMLHLAVLVVFAPTHHYSAYLLIKEMVVVTFSQPK